MLAKLWKTQSSEVDEKTVSKTQFDSPEKKITPRKKAALPPPTPILKTPTDTPKRTPKSTVKESPTQDQTPKTIPKEPATFFNESPIQEPYESPVKKTDRPPAKETPKLQTVQFHDPKTAVSMDDDSALKCKRLPPVERPKTARGKTKGSWLREQMWRFLRSVGPVFLLMLYTVLGAIIFRAIEKDNELADKEAAAKSRNELVETTSKTIETNSKSAEDTKKHIMGLLNALKVTEDLHPDGKWTMWGSIYFCMSIYTTIGYGNIAPVTSVGRAVTIVYALLGIPLMLYCFITTGDTIAYLCSRLWLIICRARESIGKSTRRLKRTKSDCSEKQMSLHRQQYGSFPISILVVLTILWILFIAGLCMIFERHWNYGTALYYTLISIFTIGLGDVTFTNYEFVVIECMSLLIGLSLLSATTHLMRREIEDLAEDIKYAIDREYINAMTEARYEGEINTVDATILDHPDSDSIESHIANVDAKTVDAVVSRMPWKWRILYYLMPQSRKKQLKQRNEFHIAQRTVGTQTCGSVTSESVEIPSCEKN